MKHHIIYFKYSEQLQHKKKEKQCRFEETCVDKQCRIEETFH
jgi:hypothetical protein